ncbi:hypothetical protein BST41_09765 [Mycolicibacterium porcinum]|nr:hypothetical protein BST41_09765 [Mycolicibacterium porcinum]
MPDAAPATALAVATAATWSAIDSGAPNTVASSAMATGMTAAKPFDAQSTWVRAWSTCPAWVVRIRTMELSASSIVDARWIWCEFCDM